MKSNECSDDLIKHLANIPDCPDFVRFFLIFTRFEYALKRSGYVREKRGRGGEKYPEADWEKFGEEIKSVFKKYKCGHPDVAEAVKYLEDNPPKRQVIKDGKLEWAPMTNGDTDYKSLIRAVKQVRNNLFHGDKRIASPKDPSRNMELIKHSITVLKYLLYSSDKVKNHYDEPLE